MNTEGKLIIFSAPSGAGKTTIVQHILKTFPNIQFSVSATTRASRGEEVDGKDYYFISQESFLHKVAKHEFIEFEEVYSGTFYGTLKSEVDRIWAEGKHVIFDIDVEGGLEILVERLRSRGTDSEEKLKERIAKASKEMTYADKFDVILPNNDLASACDEAVKLVSEFLKK